MSYGTPPPPPGYGAPQYGAPPADHPRAVLILVLGILSIPCCGLFTGIPAWVLGHNALKQIDASGGAIGGRGMVKAGYICGIIGTVLSVLGVVVRVLIFNGD